MTKRRHRAFGSVCFACGPGEAGLVDGASHALLGVLGETTADPQQLSGGEGRGQRLRLGVWWGVRRGAPMQDLDCGHMENRQE